MLTAIEGIYQNGQIILKEQPESHQAVKVFVMFTDEKIEKSLKTLRPSTLLRGAWKSSNQEERNEIENYFDSIRNEWERNI